MIPVYNAAQLMHNVAMQNSCYLMKNACLHTSSHLALHNAQFALRTSYWAVIVQFSIFTSSPPQPPFHPPRKQVAQAKWNLGANLSFWLIHIVYQATEKKSFLVAQLVVPVSWGLMMLRRWLTQWWHADNDRGFRNAVCDNLDECLRLAENFLKGKNEFQQKKQKRV